MITNVSNTLIGGDPMKPNTQDLIAQQGTLPVGKPVPRGWRVLTGNASYSLVARVAYREEIEGGE